MTKDEWLNKRKFLLGPFIRLPRAEIVEILALAGYDFAIVDLEHGAIMPNEVYPMILAAENKGIRLIARVPGLQESYIKWLLDLGIGGLQIPHIKTPEDAAKAVEYARFHPEGERGLCRYVRAAEFSNIPKETYLTEANKKSVLILQIEGKEGADNIEEIIKVKGFDILFVGPYDLSQSLGLTGQIWHEKVVSEIKRIISICSDQNISTGIFTDTPEGIDRWSSLGVKYLNYRIDVEMMLNYSKTVVADIHKILQNK